MNQSMHMDYFFYPLSYDMKFILNIQDLIHVIATHHTLSKCLTSHMLVEKLIVRKCFIFKIAAMNQICTGYKIYLSEIIGKLINKSKRATFPYPTFFLDALYNLDEIFQRRMQYLILLCSVDLRVQNVCALLKSR